MKSAFNVFCILTVSGLLSFLLWKLYQEHEDVKLWLARQSERLRRIDEEERRQRREELDRLLDESRRRANMRPVESSQSEPRPLTFRTSPVQPAASTLPSMPAKVTLADKRVLVRLAEGVIQITFAPSKGKDKGTNDVFVSSDGGAIQRLIRAEALRIHRDQSRWEMLPYGDFLLEEFYKKGGVKNPEIKLTDTSSFVLRELADGLIQLHVSGGRLRAEAVSVPHLKRAIAAGALVVEGASWRLTPLGEQAVAEQRRMFPNFNSQGQIKPR